MLDAQSYPFDGMVGGTPNYFGRDTLLRAVCKGVTHQRSFAVVGGPRTGRTSTLHQIKYLLDKTWKDNPRSTKVVSAIVDLQANNSLPAMIWNEVVGALSDPAVRGGSCVVPTSKPRFVGTGAAPWDALGAACEELWTSLRGTEAWCHWVLMIDGGDRLLSREHQSAIAPLTEWVRSDAASSPINVIVAGGRTLREYLFDDTGYFNKLLRPVFLAPLRDSEASSMIASVVSGATPPQVEELIELSGSHPELLARILKEVLQYDLLENLRAARDNAALHCEVLFERIWDELDHGRNVTYRGAYAAPEHALMQLLLERGDEGCTPKNAEREIGLRPLKEYLELVEYMGLAERVLRNDFTYVRSRGAMWSTWYRERIAI